MISVDMEKVSDEIQHPFLIITLSKLDPKGVSNLVEVVYEKTTTNITLNGELKVFI